MDAQIQAMLPLMTLVGGTIIGMVVMWVLSKKSGISKHAFEALKHEHISLQATHESLAAQLDEAKARGVQIDEELRVTRETMVAIDTEKTAMEARIASHQQDLQEMKQQFQDQFENLANKIFEEKNKAFNAQSQKGLEEILGPFKERFGEFQKAVSESFGTQAKEQFALKSEIERIVKVNENMTLQTESLTKALKGDVKAQGNWGEVILEKILEDSGLMKGVDYIVQGEGLGLKHIESGKPQKPDVLVMLPEDKHIIIDAKVSLTHYERYCAEEDVAAQAEYLAQFIASMKAHVKGLEERRYQDNETLGTPDFVLMFMPIEGAYSLAVQSDRELHSYAWDKKIVIVCPSILFATLRTIESVWRLERQNQNALEIAKKGGQLYDKIASLIEDMQKLGRQLGTAQGTYDDTMKKLSTGTGNILIRTQQLEKLGAKTAKKITLKSADDENAENDEPALLDVAS